MDRRYQVFVSSTYEDLHDERREVMQSLLTLDCIPTGMELFPAADDDSWTHIQRFIQGCDYYIVIVGGRYGSRGPSGLSYTEMEYDYAIEGGLPVLAFLHEKPGVIQSNKTEPTDEGKTLLAAFRKKIEDSRHAKYWTSSSELAGKVTQGMVSIRKIKPRIGWVRANLVPDESAAQEILKLRRRIEELETQIAETAFTPPAGTETLAQGDEYFTLTYRYQTSHGFFDQNIAFSWNEILSMLGPILIAQASEDMLRGKIAEVIRNRYRDKVPQAVLLSAIPRDEDFQKIKLQLRTLGLIREIKNPAGGHLAEWTLTPYGNRQMMQVAAIRSSTKP